MLRLIVLCCLLTVSFGASIHLDGRILGGELADITDFPYQISLRHFGIPICGGSILNEYTILTAAHCTWDKFLEYLSIRAGSNSNREGGQIVQVATLTRHEKYSRLTQDYDMAILKLAEPLVFGKGVAAIELQDDGVDVAVGTDAVVSGWGHIENDGSTDFLRSVHVSTMALEDCKKKYSNRPFTDRMMCTTSDKKDACQGDSGGPLAANNKLIGVVSWGKGCGIAKYPGVYASVSVLRSWIDEHAKV